MCTISILPQVAFIPRDARLEDPRLRIVCNRDERRVRPSALPPAVRRVDGRLAIMPIDPVGGGSWIAVNDCGLAVALLNVSDETPGASAPDRQLLSRGLLVSAVAGSHSVSRALDRALTLSVADYKPFRLLLIDKDQLVECWPDATRVRHRRSLLVGPVMRTSSGLGDGVVQGPRRTLFRRLFRATNDPQVAQDGFHDHQWVGREDISVRMERPDAKTVSRTVIELTDDVVTFTYHSMDEGHVHRVSLPVGVEARRSVVCS